MPKSKRASYDAAFKLHVIERAMEVGNSQTAFELEISESMVRKWCNQKNEFAASDKKRKTFRGTKAMWPELEKELEEWIYIPRAGGRGLSTVQIRRIAHEIATNQGIFMGTAA